MARQPKPTHLKIVTGNPGKRKLPKNEPQPEGDLSKTPPSWLSPGAKMEWRFVMKNAPVGLLKEIDQSAMVAYVTAKDLHRQALEQLAKEELLSVAGNGGIIQNPLIQIANKQVALMLQAAAQMGFTPVSRTRVAMEATPEKEGGFSEFMDG